MQHALLGCSGNHEGKAEEGVAPHVWHGLEYSQAHVQLTGFNLLDEGRQVGIEKLNTHIGPLFLEIAHGRREDIGRDEGCSPQRDHLMSTFGATSDIRDCGVQLVEISPNDRQQLASMRRQLYVARGSIEQSKPNTAFQLLDQNAQSRWRDEKSFGRTREITVLCYQMKCA
jgi:hypothetical protein